MGKILDHFDSNEDEIIVDRGFVRCKVPFTLHHPNSIKKGNTQLTTKEANMYDLIGFKILNFDKNVLGLVW